MSASPIRSFLPRLALGAAAAAILLALGAAAGVWWSKRSASGVNVATGAPNAAGAQAAMAAPAAAAGERKVLYWYDPMSPNTRFDKPGRSPFMDMQLIPKYADEDSAAGTVRIDPAIAQNLGVRLATVTSSAMASEVQATGLVMFNDRDVAIVQARTGGFVERVAPLAVGDVVPAGAMLAELLVPEWGAVQREYLALRHAGQAELADAAMDRMRLVGMPEALIREVATQVKVRDRVTISTPRAGVVQELAVRTGMTLTAGSTLARINGIDTVWLDVAVPEAQAGAVRVGQSASVQLAALPGETLKGRVSALLPALNESARALRVRVELPNPGGRLRPGLSGQVALQGKSQEPGLFVPTEAVIRTGQRALVLLAQEGGRYRPVEVTLGGDVGSQTRVKSGLSEGQKVVASGQFLIDSEASLKGILAQSGGSKPSGGPAADKSASALHEAEATVDDIDTKEVTLTHGPFRSLNMPGMSMVFPLAGEHVGHGIAKGDKVVVGARQTDKGLVIERIEKQGAPR